MMSNHHARRSKPRRGAVTFLIGAILLVTQSAVPGWSRQTQYRYDALGRLTKVTTTHGSDVAEAIYDLDKSGNRVRERISAAAARVENGSFEMPMLGVFEYRPPAPTIAFVNLSGVSVHGDDWGFPAPRHGRQVGFIQTTPSFASSTTMHMVNIVPGHRYRISYALSQRPGYGINTINIYINDSLVQTVSATSQAFAVYYTPPFLANTYDARIRFEASATPTDSATGLDAVTVERLD